MRVRVNAATSVDGKLSTRRREQVEISGPEDFARVSRLRAESDAVTVGVGTVLADDPNLLVDDEALVADREAAGREPQPIRVVFDSRARTPSDARIVDDRARTVVLASSIAPDDRVDALERAGATVFEVGAGRVDPTKGLAALEGEGVDRLLVEGGGEIVFSLFAAGLVDELSVYVSSTVIGGRDAPTLADGEGFLADFPSLDLRSVDRIDDGVLLDYRVEGDR